MFLIAFVGGISLLFLLDRLPSINVLLGLACACSVLFLHRYTRLLGVIILGFLWGSLWSWYVLKDELPHSLERKDVLVIGVVVSLPDVNTKRLRFELQVEQMIDLQNNLLPFQGRIRLSWYQYNQRLSPGERWRLKVRLRRPHGFMNPGGFDYEGWLFRHRIRAMGYVRADSENRELATTRLHMINQLRSAISERMDSLFNNGQTGLIRALSVGDRSQVRQEQWTLLRQTGTNHLLAISGLHIGLLCGLAILIGRVLWSYSVTLTSKLPARQFSALFAILIGLMYTALAGFSLPTQRAAIMMLGLLLGVLSGRRWRISFIFSIALLVILLIQPFALLAVDFWLSFFVVFLIIYISYGRFGIAKLTRVKRLLWLQWAITVSLIPLLLFWFQEVPLYSFIANIVAIPLVTLLVVPLVLLAVVFIFLNSTIATFLLDICSRLLQILFYFFEWLVYLPWSNWSYTSPSLLALLFAIAGVIILFMPRGLPGRWLSVFWLLPLLIPYQNRPAFGQFHFYLLDVGQGTSAVVITAAHTLVYDTGSIWGERFDAGSAVLLPFLRKQGIKDLDIILLSHGDTDHIGGAKSVIEGIETKRLLANTDKISHPFKQPCLAGQTWFWEGVYFEILHPDRIRGSENNKSCVLKVSTPELSILLPGDIESVVEKNLLQHLGTNRLQADVIVVPHHGSMTSSKVEFIDAVVPQVALFSVGYQNRFGFPKQAIIERYQDAGAVIYTTDNSGAIFIDSAREAVTVNEFRQEQLKFWHNR